jgi:tetratricopeptide (TPR) repeat protein
MTSLSSTASGKQHRPEPQTPERERRPETGTDEGLPRALPWIAMALAVAVYAGTLAYPFVYDDMLLLGNPRLAWKFVPQFFTHNIWSQPGREIIGNYYRPLGQVWMVLNHQWFGRTAAGYHATTIAIHALMTLLVYLLARRTIREKTAAGIAALLFAVHPLHVEAVAWISGVSESGFALLFLAAMLSYLRWRELESVRVGATGSILASGSIPKEDSHGGSSAGTSGDAGREDVRPQPAHSGAAKWFVLSLAGYALSLLAKETAIVLCVLVFVYEWKFPETPHRAVPEPPTLPVRRSALRRALLVALPYGVLAAVYLVVRAVVLRGLAPAMDNQASWTTILLSFPAVLWFDLRKMIWPLPISPFYETRLVIHPGVANFVTPLVLSLAPLAGLWIWSRRSRATAIASAWLLLPLAPPLLAISHFRSYDLVHDRYLYLPSTGLVVLIALALRHLRFGGKVAGLPLAQLGATVLLVCLLGAMTAQQATPWSSSQALYRRGFEAAPRSPLALTQWAMIVLGQQHDPQAALQLGERALAEAPNDYLALLYAGIIRLNAQDDDGALPVLLQARQLHPERRDPHFFLGVVYMKKAQLREAEASFREAIRLAPDEPGQHLGLAGVLEGQGRLADARDEYRAELQLNPRSTLAARRIELIDAWLKRGASF